MSTACSRQTLERWLGGDWLHALHPDDRHAVIEQWRNAFIEGRILDLEVRLWSPDGLWRWVNARAMPMRDRCGTIVKWVGMNTEITEREQAILESHDPAAKLRLILDAVPAAISYVDREERYRFNNKAYENWFGRRADDIYGKHVREVLGEAAYERVRKDIAAALSGQRVHFERWVPYREGGTRHVSGDYVPHVLTDGSVPGFYALLSDITERKNMEDALRQLNELRQMQVASHAAAALAHELNQPLTAIASYSGAALRLVRSGQLKRDQLVETLTVNLQQTQRAAEVLRELLHKLNDRKSASEPIDLNEAVLTALTVVQAEGLSGFETVLQLEERLRPVQANLTDVQNVIANLVRNGVEAMRSAGLANECITITVRTCTEESMAHLSVRDTGPGPDAATAARIFEPFYTTKRTGVGMGLTISRALVEAHGGRLWFESGPEVGATFHFTLPFAGA